MARTSMKAKTRKAGDAAKRSADTAASAVEAAAEKAGKGARKSAGKAEAALRRAKGPSPNPMTNLIIADVALRGGGRLLRHVVERTLLGPGEFEALVDRIAAREIDPYSAAEEILTRSLRQP